VLETFDAPPMNPNCEVRPSSTVPLQSLLLMNDPFVVARAADLAERVRSGVPGLDAGARVEFLWRLLFGGPPSVAERASGVSYLRMQTAELAAGLGKGPAAADGAVRGVSAPETLALASFCQALLGSNRFLYLE
jgi:hypothetical protein